MTWIRRVRHGLLENKQGESLRTWTLWHDANRTKMLNYIVKKYFMTWTINWFRTREISVKFADNQTHSAKVVCRVKNELSRGNNYIPNEDYKCLVSPFLSARSMQVWFWMPGCILSMLRPVYTDDFCRSNSMQFCRAEVATSKSHV